MEVIIEGSTVYNGDCLEVMNTIDKCSVDSVVTDPPYHLTSIVQRFGKEDSAPAQFGTDGAFARASRGFMGKEWDGGDITFQANTWRKCYELLKPGGHLIAFSGSRTYHRMACAIEDAGFEIRDQCIWLYGSGFPKSHNIGNGWGTALKPAHEPMVLARKPLSEKSVSDNVMKHRTGAINIDDSRIRCEPNDNIVRPDRTDKQAYNFFRGGEEDVTNVRKTTKRQPRGEQTVWTDKNSGMKAEGSIFADADPRGRFPSNVMHDGSHVVEDIFPEISSRYFYSAKTNQTERNAGLHGFDAKFAPTMGDGIGVKEHNEQTATKKKNVHPTVKPVELMKYLVRLVTPKGGVVLDPFMGSGSTGMGAREEDFRFIGIEKEREYYEIAKARIKNVKPQLKLFDI